MIECPYCKSKDWKVVKFQKAENAYPLVYVDEDGRQNSENIVLCKCNNCKKSFHAYEKQAENE